MIFYLFLYFVTIYLMYYFLKNRKNLPKQFRIFNSMKTNYKRVEIDRDRYSLRKVPKNIDTIVIGSGIGGLSCAGFLSKVGKKVLVLEQHYIAGGCMHSFEEKGIEHETGIHYVGNINKRKKVLDLITDTPIEWCKMGEKNNGVYDEIYIEDEKYLFRSGEENFIKDLGKRFPGEEENIRQYIKLVKEVSKKDIFFSIKIIRSKFLLNLLKLYLKYCDKDYYKYVNMSAYDAISMFTDNETLKAVLGGQFGDYGPTPKKGNFFIHASIVNHYLEGGYFPKGGTGIIAKKIIPVIEKSGGRVLVNKKVKRILQDLNGVTFGVEMENGDKIRAKNVVSAVGLSNTFTKLIDPESTKIKKYLELNEKIGPSTGFIYCFVNLNGTPEELELRDSNLWIYPNKDYDKLLEDFEEDILKNPMPLFIACTCAKDSDWGNRYPNKSSAIILTMGKKEWFEQWENETCMKRNLNYQDLKKDLSTRMLEEGLYKYYPKTRGNVEHIEIGTPLTNQFYLGAVSGEGYGLNSNAYRFSQALDLKPETDIKNLYLTGQDVCTLGFTGALMGGVLTAHSILGYGTFLDIITDRNLISDLIKV
jgi:all-trans-retinol 13,14-reductase